MTTIDRSVAYPLEIKALVDELESEADGRFVADISHGSKSTATILVDGKKIVLSGRDCNLLLETPETVDLLYEALGSPDTVYISVGNLDLEEEVLDALERSFSAVDAE